MPGNKIDAMGAVSHAFLAGGFTTRSDYTRAHSEAVAQAACLGLLTTQEPQTGIFGNVWRPTALGLTLLFKDVPQFNENPVQGTDAGAVSRTRPADSRLFGDRYSG